MCNEWIECELGDVITLKRGYDLPKRRRIKGEYPIVSSSGITDYHQEAKVSAPGVVTGRYGTLGEVFYISKDFWPLNTSLYVRDYKENHPRYIYYLLKTLNFQLQNVAGAVPGVNRNYLHMLPVLIPTLPTQRKIADILSAYDDLIDNNTRRIQILEEMAQAIYREWLVHFRFPGCEKVRMVDSVSQFGMIPEGWEVKTLADVLENLESGSRPKGGINPDDTDVPSIGAENILGLGKYDFTKEKFISFEFFDNMKKGIIKDSDVLLYKDGAKLGRKSLFRDGFPHGLCCINEHVFILRSNNRCTQSYLYFWLDLSNMTEAIINLNSNAAQPGISQAKVKTLPILIPDTGTLNALEEIIEPILALLFNLAKKNIHLRATRDLLLPKLISGDMDVSHLEVSV